MTTGYRSDTWNVRYVPLTTREAIKRIANQHQLTIAQTLALLVEQYKNGEPK